ELIEQRAGPAIDVITVAARIPRARLGVEYCLELVIRDLIERLEREWIRLARRRECGEHEHHRHHSLPEHGYAPVQVPGAAHPRPVWNPCAVPFLTAPRNARFHPTFRPARPILHTPVRNDARPGFHRR